MSNDRMHRVLALKRQLMAIRAEFDQLHTAGLPSAGACPVYQAVDYLLQAEARLDDALFDCGLISDDEA